MSNVDIIQDYYDFGLEEDSNTRFVHTITEDERWLKNASNFFFTVILMLVFVH
jgi:hypothetical protein